MNDLRIAELDVIAERRRQIDIEGWTADHDDLHTRGEMACAGAAYGLAGGMLDFLVIKIWPWAMQWLKPTTRRRNLVKGAALYIAEIERIDRGGT